MKEKQFRKLADEIWQNEESVDVTEAERADCRIELLDRWRELKQQIGPPESFEAMVIYDWAASLMPLSPPS